MTRQDFTKLEKRIFLKAFAQINQGMNLQKDLFNQTIEVYFQFGEFGDSNWVQVKKAAHKLLQRTVVPIDNDTEFEGYNWVSGVKAKKNEGITVIFNNSVNEILMELSKGYTKLQLDLMMTLQSAYTQRLYELLSHWYDTGRKQPFEMDFIKEALNIPSSYSLTKIKERVFDLARTELAEKTDIVFDYEVIKVRSRSYNYVQFYIDKTSAKKSNGLDLSILDERSKRCYERAKEYGINNEQDLKKIVDSLQDQFWKLNASYKHEGLTPSAGKVLVDLGLRQSQFEMDI